MLPQLHTEPADLQKAVKEGIMIAIRTEIWQKRERERERRGMMAENVRERGGAVRVTQRPRGERIEMDLAANRERERESVCLCV